MTVIRFMPCPRLKEVCWALFAVAVVVLVQEAAAEAITAAAAGKSLPENSS